MFTFSPLSSLWSWSSPPLSAADEPIRQAGYYLPMIFGAIGTWAAYKAGLLEMDYEERKAHHAAHAAA